MRSKVAKGRTCLVTDSTVGSIDRAAVELENPHTDNAGDMSRLSVPPVRPTFETLPRELRDQIYSFLLLDSKVALDQELYEGEPIICEYDCVLKPRYSTNIFRVNKNISLETLTYFYCQNAFVHIEAIGRRPPLSVIRAYGIPISSTRHCTVIKHAALKMRIKYKKFGGDPDESYGNRPKGRELSNCVMAGHHLPTFVRLLNADNVTSRVGSKLNNDHPIRKISLWANPTSRLYKGTAKTQLIITRSLAGIHRTQRAAEPTPLQNTKAKMAKSLQKMFVKARQTFRKAVDMETPLRSGHEPELCLKGGFTLDQSLQIASSILPHLTFVESVPLAKATISIAENSFQAGDYIAVQQECGLVARLLGGCGAAPRGLYLTYQNTGICVMEVARILMRSTLLAQKIGDVQYARRTIMQVLQIIIWCEPDLEDQEVVDAFLLQATFDIERSGSTGVQQQFQRVLEDEPDNVEYRDGLQKIEKMIREKEAAGTKETEN